MMVRYLLTDTEREILTSHLKGEKVENKKFLAVILHRLKKLNLDVIHGDVQLIEKAKADEKMEEKCKGCCVVKKKEPCIDFKCNPCTVLKMRIR